jgi:hypothetical protein
MICVLEVAAAIKFVGAVGGLWVGSDGAVGFGVFTDALHPWRIRISAKDPAKQAGTEHNLDVGRTTLKEDSSRSLSTSSVRCVQRPNAGGGGVATSKDNQAKLHEKLASGNVKFHVTGYMT